MGEANTKTRVISIDGPDGTGKTTQLQLLEDKLKDSGLRAYRTKISGGTPLAMELRKVANSDLERGGDVDLYIHFAMYSSLAHELGRIKHDYDVILIDRSPLCLIAYDGVAAGLDDLEEARKGCLKYFIDMDISTVLFLDAPQDLLNSRRSKRHKASSYYENQGSEYFRNIRKGYDQAIDYMNFQQEHQVDILRLDASGSIDQIAGEISKKLELA